ncbi:pappalysin-1-like [Diadema antillarum]|uniref:pappalysin-1-like n=1 Tax=Diadema antillarum TaxID=105358 RepID=UPI003A85AA37
MLQLCISILLGLALYPPSYGSLELPFEDAQLAGDEPLRRFVRELDGGGRRDISNQCHDTDRFQGKDHARFPRHAHGLDTTDLSNGPQKAVYFRGRSDSLLYKRMHEDGFQFPRQNFTLELWVKPEGGQSSPAVIAELSDKCRTSNTVRGWSLFVDSTNPSTNGDAEIQFNLQTDRSIESTTVRSQRPLQPNEWMHVAVTYDGWKVKMYLDGAMMGAAVGQRGAVFSLVSQRCKEFTLGGSLITHAPFRGAVGHLRVYGVALSHEQIASSAVSMATSMLDDIVLSEDFHGELLTEWSPREMNEPRIVTMDLRRPPTHPQILAPRCGMTVCDHPEVARSFIGNWELRQEKIIRYRPIVLAKDDGSNPTITSNDLRRQHSILSAAYRPHNITWQSVETLLVRNSSLRRRLVLSGRKKWIGNGECDEGFNHTATGFDGGDCDWVRSECAQSLISDGACQPECNKFYHDWDGGDCCDPDVTDPLETCFDPYSSIRAYMTSGELKHAINVSGSDALAIFFVDIVEKDVEGFSTLPWNVNALRTQGGVVLKGGSHLSDNSLIHETGHVLGLLHVHHGIEAMSCDDPCRELAPSLETGDLVADTNPTPLNMHCRDPCPAESDMASCDGRPTIYTNTPYRNYMGYSNAGCTDHFTPQQGARMHCYINLMYSSWAPSPSPSTIPLPPRVMSEDPEGGVTIAWIPPLSGHAQQQQQQHEEGEAPSAHCLDCTLDDAFAQYARRATTNQNERTAYVDPSEATGPPNAGKCELDSQAWLAATRSSRDCSLCYLDLEFDHLVVPARLSIWFNYVDQPIDTVSDVILTYEDQTTESLGSISADCDTPFTTRLFATKRLLRLRILIHRSWTSVDAVQIISARNSSVCQSCAHARYSITRDPPFEENGESSLRKVETTWFHDRSARDGVQYSYRVQQITGDSFGPLSPPLHHTLGDMFCGNGRIDGLDEECDDENHDDGDGCDRLCLVEDRFVCEGEPSRCRRTDGDGVCEEFERPTSQQDCGFYTPPGFLDQWASSAVANPLYQGPECSEDVLLGEPRPNKVGFPKSVIASAVIVHLGGIRVYDVEKVLPLVSAELLNPEGQPHTQLSTVAVASCEDSPIQFNISHDLTKPFVYTKYVRIQLSSPQIAISGVRLRSLVNFNPIALSECTGHQVFNPALGRCVDYQCERPTCATPTFPFADVTCSGLNEGDVCEVNCILGYRPSSPIMLQCVDGQWEGPALVCSPVDCVWAPFLDSSLTSIDCPAGTTFGQECFLNCVPPARLQGNDNSLRCEDDGLFSLAQSFCQVLCDEPADPPHAILQSQNCRGDGHNVGTTCKFKCKAGYTAANKKGRATRTVRYRCTENSTWEGADCTPVVCPEPAPWFHGLYNCTNGFMYKSQCTLHCSNASLSNTITCTKDGQWDREFALCDPSTVCPEPLPSQDIDIDCPSGHGVGARCRVRCRQGQGFSHQVALEGATFRDRGLLGNNNLVVCTARGEWYPDVDLIRCQERCWEAFADDDQCEAENNRAFCLWDGGACCPSTAPGGEVNLFMPNCGQACACRDPEAMENAHRQNGFDRDINRPPL